MSAADGSSGQRRPGRGGFTKKGKPRPGTGGHGKRRLEGKGPTPPAHLRPGHPAERRAEARRASRPAGDGGDRAAGSPEEASRGASSRRAAPGEFGRGASTRRAGAPGEAGRGASSRRAGAPGEAGRGASSRRAAPGEAGRGASTRRAGPPGEFGRGASSRRADGHEIVAGRNAVLEALQAAVPGATLYVAYRMETDDRVHASVKLAADAGIPVLETGRAELDRLTQGAVHQGLALRVRPYQYAHPDDLTARSAAAGDPALIVALDGVTDPRNLGAVVRCAAAFGAHGVVIPARRSAGVSAGAWKASAGTLARLPVAQTPNLARVLAAYQEAGLFVVGLAADGSTGIADLELASSPLVLVVGSEGKGLSRVVAERCDLLARIPIADAESLNASVAAGVALYETARRRSSPGD